MSVLQWDSVILGGYKTVTLSQCSIRCKTMITAVWLAVTHKSSSQLSKDPSYTGREWQKLFKCYTVDMHKTSVLRDVQKVWRVNDTQGIQ